MKVEITGTAKEIAALVLELQGQQLAPSQFTVDRKALKQAIHDTNEAMKVKFCSLTEEEELH